MAYFISSLLCHFVTDKPATGITTVAAGPVFYDYEMLLTMFF